MTFNVFQKILLFSLYLTDRSTNIETMGRTSNAKQRILDSACQLIYSRSYANVGIQEICNLAEVQKGSFYHFFRSKRDLTLAMLDHFQEFSGAHMMQAFAPEIPPLDRFDRFVQLGYEEQKKLKEETGHMPGCPFSNLASELSTQDEVIRAKLDGIFRDMIAPFEQALRDAIAEGLIPESDVTTTAEGIFAYFEGIVLLAKTRNDPELLLKLGPNAVRIAYVPSEPSEKI
jgi:TetR/AcrR family transcriptional repressor of nem operon